MKFQRGSGILLHITSLPSAFGIGDLGPEAYRFVDRLAKARQRYWQVLPLGQTGYGNSPYSCYSAYAGNIYLLSPERLLAPEGSSNVTSQWFDTVRDEINSNADELSEQGTSGTRSKIDKVDFGQAIGNKLAILRRAFEAFRRTADENLAREFHRFCDENSFWLEDYSLYRAVTLANDYSPWQDWEDGLKDREQQALEKARCDLDDEAFAQKYYQFEFFRQWKALKAYANDKGIKIIGDIPIYLTRDSCDAWCNRNLFKLNEDGSPKLVSGVPPDYFSEDGQLWGSPVYDWQKMRDDGFRWWADRMKFNLAMFDILRIDHFIGFTRAWEVPAGDSTARNGSWAVVPGGDFFSTIKFAFGDLPMIAEDLGEVTPEVEELRDSFGIPGMRILQFAFGGGADNLHMPHNYIPNAVVYTGTHDNDTVVGWYKQKKKQRRGRPADQALLHCLKYLETDGREINWAFIRAALASVAAIAIIPMQDVLGLDNSARMNLPASMGENWTWRMSEGQFTEKEAERLAELCGLFNRG